MTRDLNDFRKIRQLVLTLRRRFLQWKHQILIHPTSTVSTSARIISGGKDSIVVGEETLIALKSMIISRTNLGEVRSVHIGRRCFIGGGSIILPGVTIGDEVIVGAGSVVFDDIPSKCAVGGNPARILRTNISVGPYGRLTVAAENQLKNKL